MRSVGDIAVREDIEKVLAAFYGRAIEDPLIGRFFTEVVPLHLPTHLPLITDFWVSVLFQSRGYGKNVMQIHQNISSLSPIVKEHLDRWVQLFTQTIDSLFTGEKANLMKQRGASIATMMDIKLNHSQV